MAENLVASTAYSYDDFGWLAGLSSSECGKIRNTLLDKPVVAHVTRKTELAANSVFRPFG